MDSNISLGQKNTLAEYMILFGADNRPPMLDKDLLPPEWSKFVTDVKLVKDLHTSNFDQLHAYLEQHELHANEVRLILIPQVAYQSPPPTAQHMSESPFVDSGFADLVVSLVDDPIACLNKAMAFLTDVASLRFPSTNNQLKTSFNLRNQATIQDDRVTMQQVQGRKGQNYSGTTYKSHATSSKGNTAKKAMLAESQEARKMLDEEQLAFLADLRIPASQAQTIIPHNVAFQTEDLDTYDCNCDDLSTTQAVLMANISNYGSDIILESSVDKQCLEIANKELLLENDRLSIQIMSQDIVSTIMDFMSFNVDCMHVGIQRSKSCEMCLNLDVEFSKSKQAYDDLLKNYSQLKKHCISLEMLIQLNQEIFQKNESCINQNAPEIPKYFEKNDLKAQLQDKDTTICKLKDTIKSLRKNNREEIVDHDRCDPATTNEELENSVAKLLSKNERLCKEINHVKQVLKISLTQSNRHVFFKKNIVTL
nr:hypothetical protein [Tanacetum cinerariifolium]